MADPLSLPPGAALAVIAFLLSLLPAGFFIWLWYLRRRERVISPGPMALAALVGAALVFPAFWLEDMAEQAWQTVSPQTVHYFAGAVLPLTQLRDLLLPALATFAVVALVEEGLRYILLRVWIRRSRRIDQVFDGLLLGVAVGLGFATLENTLYFLNLFRESSYDTLVFVFFLRFLISTIAHISFAGLMGALIARGVFDLYNKRRYFIPAFFIPWFLHGLYDFLLGINNGLYAVLILLPALFVLIYWTGKREYSIIYRRDGHLLAAAQAPATREMRAVQKVLKTLDSPWNLHAPWLSQSKSYRRILESMNQDET